MSEWEQQRGSTLRHSSRVPEEGPGPCSRRQDTRGPGRVVWRWQARPGKSRIHPLGQDGPQAPAGRNARDGYRDSLRLTPGCHTHPGPGKLRLATDLGPSSARLRDWLLSLLKRTGVRRH